jgi:chromosome segregation ATPase
MIMPVDHPTTFGELLAFAVGRWHGVREVGPPQIGSATMVANQSVEQRLSVLEARMGELQQLPARIDRLEARIDRLEGDLREEIRTGHVMIVTALTEQVEDARRHMLVLHEDVLDRFRLVWERLSAHDDKFDAHDRKLDAHDRKLDAHDRKIDALAGKIDALAEKVDAGQDQNRGMFAQILSRLDAPRKPPTRKRP